LSFMLITGYKAKDQCKSYQKFHGEKIQLFM
jgi:hypothetical protein